jgi:Icc-related predicted phosphoesterase
MKVLSLSDITLPFIHSTQVRNRFPDIDLVFGCGDLPYEYLEFIVSMLYIPVYYVRGNHSKIVEYSTAGPTDSPLGAVNLHRRMINHFGLLIAGVEGSGRYSPGPFQYSQTEMWLHVLRLVPAFLFNRLFHGRYLDIFVSHASPWGIHDQSDLPHQGIKAFLWLIQTFQPAYHFHGHVHIYRPDTPRVTRVGRTQVINSYGYYETFIDLNQLQAYRPAKLRKNV